jgi:hypothetical protein
MESEFTELCEQITESLIIKRGACGITSISISPSTLVQKGHQSTTKKTLELDFALTHAEGWGEETYDGISFWVYLGMRVSISHELKTIVCSICNFVIFISYILQHFEVM